MAQSLLQTNHLDSNENSISTKEFLHLEQSCELNKDSDEEIKLIFQEIKKLSDASSNNKFVVIETDDVELILKKAEDIAQETEGILKNDSSLGSKTVNGLIPVKTSNWINPDIPQIKITKPQDEQRLGNSEKESKGIPTAKHATKENTHDARRKTKLRPFSAGVLDTRKREVKARTVSGSPKKPSNFKQESILEDLKDTNERAKSLELFNVKLTEDNKNLRKRLAQVEEEKHIVDLKLAECENLISKLGREFDNRNLELKAIKENESRLLVELNRERNDRKNLTIQRDKDVNVIQDLQRQCKEMEMILKRKHPDSVSALIVAAKSSTVEDNKKKLLEERIARLEQELKDKEDHFQHILVTLQEKFTDMKQKYESHIIDVERQLMGDRKLNSELRSRANKFETVESATQTLEKVKHAIGTQTRLRSADAHSSTVSRLTQSSSIILNKLKEDSYLVATIKGLQTELTTKQRTIAKINRETEELKKNLRNLRKEKEVLMNLNLQKKGTRQKKSVETILGRVNTELESELAEARQQAEMMAQERNSLLDSLKWTNEELILLKRKRIQDLHTLQLAHEKELMQMNMQLTPLQEEIQMLNRTVEILQARVRSADEKLVRYQVGVRDVEINGSGDACAARNSAKK